MTAAVPAANFSFNPLEDPAVFLAVEDLELVGHGLAEAVWHGQHVSQLRGDGVEFHSHRSYQTGDDLRRVNWALYARLRKLNIKQSRQESRRPVYILADATASMSIRHGLWTKWHYAARVAAGLAWLAKRQGDAPALGILNGGGVAHFLPARQSADHLSGLCAALTGVRPEGPGNIAAALLPCQGLCRQRGFVILISDFFDAEEKILSELAGYRAQGHDVLALQVLDPCEIALPAGGDFDFEDPETGRVLRTSTESLHAAYARRVAAWRESLRHRAAGLGLRWLSTSTEASLTAVLRQWLAGT
ncbi:MAG: DUF58 domain-containing protein [Verrucomicrobiota bacterium]